MSTPRPLPEYNEDQFRLAEPQECDAIMKGGITSGIVYPYAILEIATRYRFRSLGGTSAGAIAAAFAAAAEYSRSMRNDPAGFVRLKRYCDELPDKLLGLFQPDPELEPAVKLATNAIHHQSLKWLVGPIAVAALPFGLVAALAFALLLWWVGSGFTAIALGLLLGLVVGWELGLFLVARRRLVRPLLETWSTLPQRMFGFCSGLTQEGQSTLAVTDWLHRAIQDIAFGSPAAEQPLTFGHLEGASPKIAPIQLRMVATNLSMMRPHTLPDFGISAAFKPPAAGTAPAT